MVLQLGRDLLLRVLLLVLLRLLLGRSLMLLLLHYWLVAVSLLDGCLGTPGPVG